MALTYGGLNKQGLSAQIAETIRSAIMEGRLMVDERLPSETELAERFGVSRPTVREALKRLAAQNLIKTQRGPAGGAFVSRITIQDAQDAMVTTYTMLLGMNDIPFRDLVESRFTQEVACLPLSIARHSEKHLAKMEEELALQRDNSISDEEFCASDVRFHKALIKAAANPVLLFQMNSAMQAMLPLMNMITYHVRDRSYIVDLHSSLLEAVRNRKIEDASRALQDISDYTIALFDKRNETPVEAY